ncbi:PREDICTED: uncharacterized protein LOC106815939, partial [Priapulus caudatus]|uniref:Uncharacterized protein LOC106815939 n=1 Tax=Priapulus caudatus TaxID=37621 RepID=A0ABM1EUT6_PRICU
MMIGVVAAVITLWVLYKLTCCVEFEPLLGRYSFPGKWFAIKNALVLAVLHWRRWRQQRRQPNVSHVVSSPCCLLERPQSLGCVEHAIDSVYFNGFDKAGNSLVVRIGRRKERCAEVWLMLKLSDGRYFHYPSFPQTQSY